MMSSDIVMNLSISLFLYLPAYLYLYISTSVCFLVFPLCSVYLKLSCLSRPDRADWEDPLKYCWWWWPYIIIIVLEYTESVLTLWRGKKSSDIVWEFGRSTTETTETTAIRWSRPTGTVFTFLSSLAPFDDRRSWCSRGRNFRTPNGGRSRSIGTVPLIGEAMPQEAGEHHSHGGGKNHPNQSWFEDFGTKPSQ
jgi:hypothetical protein